MVHITLNVTCYLLLFTSRFRCVVIDLKTVLHICYTSVTHRKPTHMCNRFARPKGQLSMLTL